VTDKIAIVYPSIAMALFTIAMVFSLGLRRFYAVRARRVNPKYYRTYTEGDEPESMRQHSRHVQNHFEVPPLFHLAVWGTYLAGEVTAAAVFAAWFFVAARGVHSFLHLTSNIVIQRFVAYGFSLFAVLYLWLRLLISIA